MHSRNPCPAAAFLQPLCRDLRAFVFITINTQSHGSDVGPHPVRPEIWTARPREHAFRRCSFREWQFKYNTRKCVLGKVQALNSSEPSVPSDFQSFLRLSNFLKQKSSCYAYFRSSNRGGTPTNRFYSLDLVWKCRFVNLLSPGIAKKVYLFHAFFSILKEQCTGLYAYKLLSSSIVSSLIVGS